MRMVSKIEQEINHIRLAIYEETKDMTPAQRADRVNRIGEAAAKRHGFKIATSANGNRILKNRA